MQPEAQHIIKALLEAAARLKGLFILSYDGVLTFKTGANQVFLNQNVNIAGTVLGNIVQNQGEGRPAQGDLFQALPQGGTIRQLV